MTIQDWGAIGEVVGAIGVIASLLYLARQIKHANTRSQASARYSFLDAYGQVNLAMAQSKQLTSVVRRGLKGESLDDDERLQFFSVIGQWWNTWSVMFDLYTEKQLPPSQWLAVRKDILSTLNTPGGRDWWIKIGPSGLHPEFVREVDGLLKSDEETYDILDH